MAQFNADSKLFATSKELWNPTSSIISEEHKPFNRSNYAGGQRTNFVTRSRTTRILLLSTFLLLFMLLPNNAMAGDPLPIDNRYPPSPCNGIDNEEILWETPYGWGSWDYFEIRRYLQYSVPTEMGWYGEQTIEFTIRYVYRKLPDGTVDIQILQGD